MTTPETLMVHTNFGPLQLFFSKHDSKEVGQVSIIFPSLMANLQITTSYFSIQKHRIPDFFYNTTNCVLLNKKEEANISKLILKYNLLEKISFRTIQTANHGNLTIIFSSSANKKSYVEIFYPNGNHDIFSSFEISLDGNYITFYSAQEIVGEYSGITLKDEDWLQKNVREYRL